MRAARAAVRDACTVASSVSARHTDRRVISSAYFERSPTHQCERKQPQQVAHNGLILSDRCRQQRRPLCSQKRRLVGATSSARCTRLASCTRRQRSNGVAVLAHCRCEPGKNSGCVAAEGITIVGGVHSCSVVTPESQLQRS